MPQFKCIFCTPFLWPGFRKSPVSSLFFTPSTLSLFAQILLPLFITNHANHTIKGVREVHAWQGVESLLYYHCEYIHIFKYLKFIITNAPLCRGVLLDLGEKGVRWFPLGVIFVVLPG